MASQSTYVRVAPSPRLNDSQTPANSDLVQLRVRHLLPRTTQRARERVAKLKKLFTVPADALLQEHAAAKAATLQRLRLVKSVRNIRIHSSSSSSTTSGVAGALCLPFHACAALPAMDCVPPNTSATTSPLAGVLTGSVDGILTLWDAELCTPLCSQSTFPDGRGWGRVKSICAYPAQTAVEAAASSSLSSPVSTCFAFTASMFQQEVRVWRVRVAEHDDQDAPQNEEEADGQNSGASQRAPRATLDPITTASCGGSLSDALGDGSTSHASESATRIGGLEKVAVDPTGALLAATHASGVVRLWDVRGLLDGMSPSAASQPLQLLCTQDGYETAGATLGLAFHPDGSLLTTTDAGGRVVAWDTRSGQLAFHTGGRIGGHLQAALCVAWSPCGVRLASGGADGVVHLYDARKLSRAGLGPHNDPASHGGAAPFQLFGHDDAVTSLSFYSNPAYPAESARAALPVGVVSTSLDHTLRLWDADTGLCVRSLDAGMPLYGHCRPALQPLSHHAPAAAAAASTSTSSAVMAVGHGKNWLLYDVGLRGEVEEGPVAPVQVTETDIVASADGGASGGLTFAKGSSDAHRAAATAVRDEESSEEEEEEEEEDEMMALMTTAKAKSTAAAAEKEEEDDEEESSEDEMEMLRKKK